MERERGGGVGGGDEEGGGGGGRRGGEGRGRDVLAVLHYTYKGKEMRSGSEGAVAPRGRSA